MRSQYNIVESQQALGNLWLEFVDVKTSGSDGTVTLAIQTVGEPYVVQVRSDGMVLFDFSDWNAPVNVTAPAGAVSPADLMKEVGPSS